MPLPQARSELIDARRRMLSNSLQNVDEIGVDVDTMEPAGHNEALDNTNLFGTKLGPTEIPVFTRMEVFPYPQVWIVRRYGRGFVRCASGALHFPSRTHIVCSICLT